MTFDEEFDSLSISSEGEIRDKRWVDSLWYKGSAGGKQCYRRAAEPGSPFTIKDGVLTITARRKMTGCRFDWSSGILVSIDSRGNGFKQTYGYFEMKARLPRPVGFWPAFWLMDVDHVLRGSPVSEIDIMEGQTSTPQILYTTIHTHDPAYQSVHPMTPAVIEGPNWQNRDNRHVVQGMSENFHTYGLYWDKFRLTFFFDRRPMLTLPTPSDFDRPMYVIVNLDVGGWSGDPVEGENVEGQFTIDYIRAFSSDPTSVAVGVNPEMNSGFRP